MHEHSLVASLLSQTAQLAAAHGGGEVERIHLQIGPLAGVETALLREAFVRLRAGTIAANAELSIDAVGLTCRCERCQLTFGTEDFRASCPQCGLPGVVVAGDAVVLESIQIRVPEASGLLQ